MRYSAHNRRNEMRNPTTVPSQNAPSSISKGLQTFNRLAHCQPLPSQRLSRCAVLFVSAQPPFTAGKHVFPLTDTWAPCRPAGPQRPASLELQAQRTSCAVTPTIRSNQLNFPLPSTYIARATHFVLLHVANATVGDKPSFQLPQSADVRYHC